jgi:tRNA U34 2-thiouridine synthase MnmA/TrmU
VEKIDEKNYKVVFDRNQRAIASGQICAIYLDDELIMS